MRKKTAAAKLCEYRINDIDNEREVDACLKEAEIDCDDRDTFPSGQDKLVSREFDGVDVSRGQWQRIAMARGDYRDKRYFILDEPTVAIDPLEEARVYKKTLAAPNCVRLYSLRTEWLQPTSPTGLLSWITAELSRADRTTVLSPPAASITRFDPPSPVGMRYNQNKLL